ncbi:MAG: hypothetical protein ACJ8OJ_08515 [Povalibacter sp.]
MIVTRSGLERRLLQSTPNLRKTGNFTPVPALVTITSVCAIALPFPVTTRQRSFPPLAPPDDLAGDVPSPPGTLFVSVIMLCAPEMRE